MDASDFRKYAPRLGRHAFASFALDLFRETSNARGDYEKFLPLEHAGEDVFYKPLRDSYGQSIHSVFVLHFPPLELFRPNEKIDMRDPALIRQLARIRNTYHGKTGYRGMVSPFLKRDHALSSIAFITNLSGLEKGIYQDMLLPAYQRLKRYCGLKRPLVFVGSCDSFIETAGADAVSIFGRFIEKHRDGVAISVGEHERKASSFTSERNLSGVLTASKSPYEPVFLSAAIKERARLNEFDGLLASDASESKLEELLTANYQALFGSRYDRIETQLWLRFPDLDLGNRSRRLDMFLRNSVTNDWHLFEIKRPVAITRTIRDVPVISHHLVEAIHQIKNYSRLLSQDRVKRHFAASGIEYFEPCLTVVIGRTPEIPLAQWRWLKSENERSVSVLTFDELRSELLSRLQDRYALIRSFNT